MSIPSLLTLDMFLCPFVCKMDRWHLSSIAAADVNIYHTRFFELGVIATYTLTLGADVSLETLLFLSQYHLSSAQPLQACFTVLFLTYIKIILHDSV